MEITFLNVLTGGLFIISLVISIFLIGSFVADVIIAFDNFKKRWLGDD
jgi:hypothetical protein